MGDIVDNLKKLCREHENQIHELRQKIATLELIPKAQSLVGVCFRSPNVYGYFNFGIPNSKRKSYIYRRITGYDKEYVIVDTFFMDHPGKIEILCGERQYVTNFTSKNMIPISEKEYFRAFNKLIKHINATMQKEK